MFHGNHNYIDGVPVKISENFKPPPKLSLPQKIIQRLSNADSASTSIVDRCSYAFELEHNVLAKITEWSNVRQQERYERRERISQREQEKQKQMEQKQKQMLTAVSYPSAEDLSSDEDLSNAMENNSKDLSPVTPANSYSSPISSPILQTHHEEITATPVRFDTILMPTVIPGRELNNYNNCDGYTNFDNAHLTRINYSDFENDTSSPFDNIELKTINDLDILAQVLNKSAVIHSNNSNDTEVATKNNITASDTSPATINSVTTNDAFQPKTDEPNSNSSPTLTVNENTSCNHSPQTIQYASYNQQSVQHMPIANYNMYAAASNYNYNYNNPSLQQINPSSEYPPPQQQNLYYNYNNSVYQNMNNLSNYAPSYLYSGNSVVAGAGSVPNPDFFSPTNVEQQNQHKLKSKSVPDIVKEINNEIDNSEMRRTRNNSQSVNSPTVEYKHNSIIQQKSLRQNETFHKLSTSSQRLIMDISSMGFPVEQVIRIASKFGKDDKKIVEHLIPLGELLDLGFDELKISEALIQFNNNKEKALDYLIS